MKRRKWEVGAYAVRTLGAMRAIPLRPVATVSLRSVRALCRSRSGMHVSSKVQNPALAALFADFSLCLTCNLTYFVTYIYVVLLSAKRLDYRVEHIQRDRFT